MLFKPPQLYRDMHHRSRFISSTIINSDHGTNKRTRQISTCAWKCTREEWKTGLLVSMMNLWPIQRAGSGGLARITVVPFVWIYCIDLFIVWIPVCWGDRLLHVYIDSIGFILQNIGNHIWRISRWKKHRWMFLIRSFVGVFFQDVCMPERQGIAVEFLSGWRLV